MADALVRGERIRSSIEPETVGQRLANGPGTPSAPLRRASFSQVPYAKLSDRITKGSRVVIDLHGLVRGRMECLDKELLFSDKISRTNSYEGEISCSSSEKSIGLLKNYFLYLTREQAELRKSFEEKVVKELECLKLTRAKIVTHHQGICEQALNDVDTAYSRLDLAKDKERYTKNSLRESQQKLKTIEEEISRTRKASPDERRAREKEKEKNTLGRMFGFHSSPEQDKEKQNKKMRKLMVEHRNCIEEIGIRRKDLLTKINMRDTVLEKVKTKNLLS